MSDRTRQAVQHTLHCLIGCGIGEIVGMLIAAGFGWHRLGRVLLSVALAFCFGYFLTYRGVRKHTRTAAEALRITAGTDTISIASMELIDTGMELLIPNALMVSVDSARFWWGLALSLSIAFVVTVPVNRLMIGNSHADHAHIHHH